jgi:4-hydroxymandelate oxidase
MQHLTERAKARRKFLRFVAASPLLAASETLVKAVERLSATDPARTDGLAALEDLQEALQQRGDLISSPEQALDVMDFEAVARRALPPAHFAYMATGVDDDATVLANRAGFQKFEIRSRRLVDVEKIDLSVRLFGTEWSSPVVLSPAGSQKAFHPGGEIAVARAARAKGHLQILSTVSTSSIEDVTAARGAPVWFQLYAVNDWQVVQGMVKRAEKAGCPVMALTLDNQDGTNRETLFRARRMDSRDCTLCHQTGIANQLQHKPMFDGLDTSKVTALTWPNMTWDYVKRLKDATSMKLVLKGIVTREDAQLAVQNGADGILVSNHGGRTEETLRSTIESLPEVIEGTGGKIPVLVDGGFRRGTDVFKALAMGACSVGIGRPYLWGLAAFGQPGVETVLTILRRETRTIMRQAGTPTIAAITHASIMNR